MKKVLNVLSLGLFLSGLIFSCSPDEIQKPVTEALELNHDQQATDKEENCPPNDRNCNGVPDNEEGEQN